MSTGTLDPMGGLVLPPCTPTRPRRPAGDTIPMALAVAHSFGLLALFALGSLPYLLTLLTRPRRL